MQDNTNITGNKPLFSSIKVGKTWENIGVEGR